MKLQYEENICKKKIRSDNMKNYNILIDTKTSETHFILSLDGVFLRQYAKVRTH